MQSTRRARGALFAAAAALLLSLPAFAQDGPQAQTAQDATISTSDLQSHLRPMRQAEVEAELEAWLGVLQAKAEEIAGVEIARRQAEESGNTDQIGQLTEQLAGLRTERGDIQERVETVITTATEKGSDTAEATAYVGSITGSAPIEVTGFQSAIAEIRTWFMSKDGGLKWLMNIGQFIGVLLVFKILAKVIAGLLDRAVRRLKKTSDLLRDFVVNVTRKLVFFIGIVIALSYVGVNIAPLVAAIGAAGFIVGFALQGTLQNFAAGIMILIYRPYDLGDVVSAGGVMGTVDSMNLVSTSIKTPDNQTIVVPNGTIWGDVITNVTANDTRRLDLTYGVGYEDDLDKVGRVLEEVVKAHPKVLASPEPTIQVHELADSSVNFIARPWVNTSDYWGVFWDLQKQVKQRFDKEGIAIPFPQRDVHLYSQQA